MTKTTKEQRDLVRTALAAKLRSIHAALDDHLGDCDVTHLEDDDERDQVPGQWAARELMGVIEDLEKSASAQTRDALDVTIPCAVSIDPATRIRPGVKLGTLLHALEVRGMSDKPREALTTNSFPDAVGELPNNLRLAAQMCRESQFGPNEDMARGFEKSAEAAERAIRRGSGQ